jgi:uncharacterized membrane protein HdeD (DUF308 family)
MAAWKRWQDWAEVVLGILFIISPFAFGANAMGMMNATWTAVVLGILIALAGLFNLAMPANPAGEWIAGILGILAFISPWVIGFTSLMSLAWTAWIIGVLTFIAAALVLFGGRSLTTGHPAAA